MFKVEDGLIKVEKCEIKFSEPDCKKARRSQFLQNLKSFV